MIFQNETMPFQAIKTRSSKSRKIVIFPRGVTHGFGPKMAIFETFVFRQYKPGKCLVRYSKTKKRFSRLQKQEVQKIDKMTFFQKGLSQGFCQKMANFPTIFFRQDRSRIFFYAILEQKNIFLGYKNKKFKKSKNQHFFKGVNPLFWSKNSYFFQLFFLSNI